jgi:hypothetical protein
VAAERQQARLVALDEGVEGPVLALAAERDELLVALEPQKGRPARKCGSAQGLI